MYAVLCIYDTIHTLVSSNASIERQQDMLFFGASPKERVLFYNLPFMHACGLHCLVSNISFGPVMTYSSQWMGMCLRGWMAVWMDRWNGFTACTSTLVNA